jgi:8-oxo-dGTP pyrophosphatase MutT (NUDIX family)
MSLRRANPAAHCSITVQSPASAWCWSDQTIDAVLLIRRRWPPYRGRWGAPGGFVAFGETPEAAAIRKVRVETGLELTWLVPSEHTEYKEGADGYPKGRPRDAAILRMVRAPPPVHLVLKLRQH